MDGTLTTFLHDGVEEIGDYNASGTLLRRYVHGPGVDEYLVMYTGTGTGNKYYFHANHQGSIVAMTDGAGNVTEQHSYDAYGNSDELTGNPFRYTGRRLDAETGLYYYRARYYSTELGRFLQTDPIGYGDGLNWYAYVGNDPVNKTDPTGLCGTRIKGHSASNCKTIWFGAEGGGGSGKNNTTENKPIHETYQKNNNSTIKAFDIDMDPGNQDEGHRHIVLRHSENSMTADGENMQGKFYNGYVLNPRIFAESVLAPAINLGIVKPAGFTENGLRKYVIDAKLPYNIGTAAPRGSMTGWQTSKVRIVLRQSRDHLLVLKVITAYPVLWD